MAHAAVASGVVLALEALEAAGSSNGLPKQMPCSVESRVGQGGAPFKYKVQALLKGLQLAQLLRNASSLPQALVSALEYTARGTLEENVTAPSGSTLSRARLVADMLLCLQRQEAWARSGLLQGNALIYLTADSSPQGGRDWLLVEEDTVCADELLRVAASIEGGDIDPAADFARQLQGLIEVGRVLPPSIVGSGCTSVAHKTHSVLHQIKLEVGAARDRLHAYCSSVVGWCSDFGVEASLADVPNIDLDAWLQECISEVDTALLETGCTSDGSLVMEHSGPDSSRSSPAGCGEGLGSRSSLAGPASLSGTGSPSTASGPINRLFPKALYVPGMKHLMDNLLKDILRQLPHYKKSIEPHLKALEHVLSNKWLRERLQQTCFADSGFESPVATWSSNLQTHRWEAVASFIKEVLPLQGPLRLLWNAKAFSHDKASKVNLRQDVDMEPTDYVQQFDAAVRSAGAGLLV